MPIASVSLAGVALILAAADGPEWLDLGSKLGVIGLLMFAGVALHRKWWVPGWVHRDLEERHERLRQRYDTALDIALTSSKGVQRSATVLEQALARAERNG